jgi:predicted aminopeptidase
MRPSHALGRAALVVAALVAAAGCWSGRYLAQQGVGQLGLLRARRRVSEVLSDPAVDADTKRRLRLAMAARDFGIEVLGLRGGDAYTRYLDMGGRPVAWNVTAAEKDRLRLHLNRFPIVGAIPYLGFFREADAQAEAARLEALGLDVYVRGVAGYSTLGMTSDPIYSSMIDGEEARIVEVMLHEMLHGTLYLPGHSDWNESLATFVGLEGAAEFLSARGDPNDATRLLADARELERDQEAFSRFLGPVLDELRALYAGPLGRAEKLKAREAVFARAQAEYLKRFPPPPGKRPGAFARRPLNNAVLLSYDVYHAATPEHRRLFARVGSNLAAFIRLYKYAVENTPDPIGYLRALR